jgi:hypothetical protein
LAVRLAGTFLSSLGIGFDKVTYLHFPSNTIPRTESVDLMANSVSLSPRVSQSLCLGVCVSLFLSPTPLFLFNVAVSSPPCFPGLLWPAFTVRGLFLLAPPSKI